VADFLLLVCCSIVALLGHGARKRKWMEWLVRLIIGGFCLFEAASLMVTEGTQSEWSNQILAATALATALVLLMPIRKLLSVVLTFTESIVSLQSFIGLVRRKLNLKVASSLLGALMCERVFIPSSIPHMVGLFVYLTALGYFLQIINPVNFDLPAMPIPLPIQIPQLLSYNGIGLVMVSFCGVGIIVTRGWKEAASRLGWLKPTLPQVGIGLALVVFCFAYELVWSIYTHGLPDQDLAAKLSGYNSGTFAAGGDFGMALLLALATALCAGIGEETLIRGALQPVLGIVPAALLHAILHAQFSHAPIFIVQIALWSICFGVVKKYTNTTTTIIGHAGFNFVTTFLFSFNP
jgi:hypothetical protein